jgi:hypothetical protein
LLPLLLPEPSVPLFFPFPFPLSLPLPLPSLLALGVEGEGPLEDMVVHVMVGAE